MLSVPPIPGGTAAAAVLVMAEERKDRRRRHRRRRLLQLAREVFCCIFAAGAKCHNFTIWRNRTLQLFSNFCPICGIRRLAGSGNVG